MYWSSKIGQDRSKNLKMYVEFTQAQARGVARGAGTVLFGLYKLWNHFMANLVDYTFIHETQN